MPDWEITSRGGAKIMNAKNGEPCINMCTHLYTPVLIHYFVLYKIYKTFSDGRNEQ